MPDYCNLVDFEKLRFQNNFRPHKKLRFCDELVWTVGLTVERKLRFQIPLPSGADETFVSIVYFKRL